MAAHDVFVLLHQPVDRDGPREQAVDILANTRQRLLYFAPVGTHPLEELMTLLRCRNVGRHRLLVRLYE